VPSFKEKRDNLQLNEESVSYGLLGYPVLQAADILIYRAHAVPVGKDQAAHLELSREIARRFNNIYGEIFPEPQAVINESTAVVPGLDGRKMSKSYNNAIYLSDTADEVAKKVNDAFTTPTKIRKTDPGVPEGCVVCQLRKLYDPGNYSTSWEEDRRGERGCVQNKRELIEILNAALEPIRSRRAELLSDPVQLDGYLKQGAEKARAAASETMQLVRAAMHVG
jgi:tryptophanyl-tRNA synthetase